MTTTSEDRWAVADRGSGWEPARVVARRRDPAATTLRLQLAEAPEVTPGQYYLVRLRTAGPPGAVQQAYSLSSSPYPPSTEVEITVREVEGGRASVTLAHRVQVGDVLSVRGPFGFLTWTERDGGPVGLIGAGSGVAPLAAIAKYAIARRATVPMTLLSSSRDRRSVFLREPLEAIARHHPWFRLTRTVTRDPTDDASSYHRRIDPRMLADVFEAAPPERRPRIYYVAGPADMVIAVRAMLGSLGVTDDRINSEDHA